MEGLSVGSRQETDSHSVGPSEEKLMKGLFAEVEVGLRQTTAGVRPSATGESRKCHHP